MSIRTAQRTHSDYFELLASIFDFMLRSGIRNNDAQTIADRALKAASEHIVDLNVGQHYGLTTAALVLDAWHRNRRYLNSKAEPIAIPLLGKAPSVQALVRSEHPSCDSESLARQLKALGLVIRTGAGRFKPASRVALVAGLDPLIQEYVARSSSTLLKTIKHNVTRRKNSPRLIERFAEVPDLPVKKIAEFRKFTQTQGWALLKTLNDWLESRRARRTSTRRTRSVRAGVHLYAYVDSRGLGLRPGR